MGNDRQRVIFSCAQPNFRWARGAGRNLRGTNDCDGGVAEGKSADHVASLRRSALAETDFCNPLVPCVGHRRDISDHRSQASLTL